MNLTWKMLMILLPMTAFSAANPFVGRWDITVTTPAATYPDWMEVTDDNGTTHARVQQRTGSVKPVLEAKIEGSKLMLTISKSPDVIWVLGPTSDKLNGTIERGGKSSGSFPQCPRRQ